MARKRKNKWEPSFRETLQSRREKDDAMYIARSKARVDGIKKALNGQVKKDRFKKILREFGDPEIRDSVELVRHKERIAFLEKVLDENRKWRADKGHPLQLKVNVEDLKAKIQEMKRYIELRSRSGSGPVQLPSDTRSRSGLRGLKHDQELIIYDRAVEKIRKVHGSIIDRLCTNVIDGLPIERARDRLESLGVTKYITDALNEYLVEKKLRLNREELQRIKMTLLHPNRVAAFLERLLVV